MFANGDQILESLIELGSCVFNCETNYVCKIDLFIQFWWKFISVCFSHIFDDDVKLEVIR